MLLRWATDKNENRIVRVNYLQGLFDFSTVNRELRQDFFLKLAEIEKENFPSLIARIKKLKKTIR